LGYSVTAGDNFLTDTDAGPDDRRRIGVSDILTEEEKQRWEAKGQQRVRQGEC